MSSAQIIAAADDRPPLEVEVRVRNHRLIAKRRELGFNCAEAARAIGVSTSLLGGLERLEGSPMGADGVWKESAVQVANFYCVTCEWLWPDVTLSVETPVVTRTLAEPDHALRLTVEQMLGSIGHPLMETVLAKRFGLMGEAESTLDEVAVEVGRSRERVRVLEARALRLLRHPSRARPMRGDEVL
jgi:hypothetical protein